MISFRVLLAFVAVICVAQAYSSDEEKLIALARSTVENLAEASKKVNWKTVVASAENVISSVLKDPETARLLDNGVVLGNYAIKEVMKGLPLLLIGG